LAGAWYTPPDLFFPALIVSNLSSSKVLSILSLSLAILVGDNPVASYLRLNHSGELTQSFSFLTADLV